MTKDDIKAITDAVCAARLEAGRMSALFESGERDGEKLSEAFDRLCAGFESGAVLLRNMREKTRENTPYSQGRAPETPDAGISGSTEVNDYGWLHIRLDALLPNCRFGSAGYITDTVTRLLDEYERRGRALPRFSEALLVIEEHCDMKSRKAFDQDNKAWKAIPNALKGRLFPDDDQFTLGIALLSEKSSVPACHIYLLPRDEAGDFFWHAQDYRDAPP
jgi:hypothetical protein